MAGHFPANLTSGGRCSHHGPAFGTGELQEGGTTCETALSLARPDNDDAPWDPHARRRAAVRA